jgi:hypothetical protein
MGDRRTIFNSMRRQTVLAAAVLGTLLTVFHAPPTQALASYARQTGQPCGTCHTDFAGLTPYGRLFKIQGYTAGGGAYRSTLFPDGSGRRPYIPPLLAKSIAVENAAGAPVSTDEKPYVPPLAMMAIVGFTNTQAPIPPPSAPYNPNNNVVVSPISFFYGGAITDHIGAFQQVTWNAPPPGGFGTDPFATHTWTWDNTDVRYADTATFGFLNVTYGITANNNPTVQDPWNTTPAWGFPYAVSTLGNGFGPTTIIDGTFAAHVASAGAYAFINNLLYLEATVYTTLSPSAQNSLGTDPFGAPGLFDAAPYWRAAFEPHWGNHWLEVGTFGMAANVHPWVAAGTAVTATFPQTDNYTSIRSISTRARISGSRCVAPTSKSERKLRQRTCVQPEQYPERSTRLRVARLRQQQPCRAHRAVFHQLGNPGRAFVPRQC